MKNKLRVIFTLLLVSVFTTSCTSEIRQSLVTMGELRAKTEELAAQTKEILAEVAVYAAKADVILKAAEEKEKLFIMALDVDEDGNLSEEEAKGALTNPTVISQLTTDISKGYATGDWASLAGTLITLLLLFQGNHIFEMRSKFKQYTGGAMKRGWSLMKTFNPYGSKEPTEPGVAGQGAVPFTKPNPVHNLATVNNPTKVTTVKTPEVDVPESK